MRKRTTSSPLCFAMIIVTVAMFFHTCTYHDALVIPTGSRAELTADSIFLYAREAYLWCDALPGYETFNPRAYATGSGTGLEQAQHELYALTQYAVNPATGKPYEYNDSSTGDARYSFVIESNGSVGVLGSVSPEGIGNDFGFAAAFTANDGVRVRHVIPGSPAAKAGLARGMRVLSINGAEATALTPGFIDEAFNKTTLQLTAMSATGTVLEATLTQARYVAGAVYKTAVLNTGNKKTGYLAYAIFSTLATSRAALDRAFAGFATAGITDLVIDLRYNGGGYVSTAEYLANLVAPAALHGAVMYSEIYNERLQQGNAPIMAHQLLRDGNGDKIPYHGRYATYADVDYSEAANTYYFSKQGPLRNIDKIVFIISGNTASAAELVISALRAHKPVILVGTPSYGKPVGFFGIRVDRYTVYMPNFRIVNALGEGEYFTGLMPGIIVSDDVTHDFGDAGEACLAQALACIAGDVTSDNGGRVEVKPPPVTAHGTAINYHRLREHRVKLRK